MARKQRKKRRRRRSGPGPLMRIASVALTAVVIVVALTLFFKVDQVVISGNSRYAESELIAASAVEPGDNLILLNKYHIAERLYTQFPYITNVRINRKLPDQLLIEVTETDAALAVESGGTWWLLNKEGKVLDATDTEGAQGYLLLQGITPENVVIGKKITLPTEGNLSAERLWELTDALAERNMLTSTDGIDTTDETILHISYDGRFDVELFYDADFAFKLDCLLAVIDKLEPNETGTLRMTMDNENEVRLIPFAP